MSFFKRIFSSEKKETLDKGLEQTKTSFFAKLTKAVAGKSSVDEDVLDNLEDVLISSDVGVKTTLNKTKGTIHGFDIAVDSLFVKDVVEQRVEFLRKVLNDE